jgi:phosphoribosylanthranilate isomerase
MPVQVKICGITTRESADAAIRAGADYLGLVFHPRSPRNVSLHEAREIAAVARGRARIAPLLANPDDFDIESVMHAVKPDLLQLHGNETHVRVAAIAHKFGVPVIKAVGVAVCDDVLHAERYEDVAEYLLFDTKGTWEDRSGGHGVPFDWTILTGRSFRRPWFLAGGLTPENVPHAIQISGATMVDVSSGVEDAPGVKNAAKMAAFVTAAKNAQSTDTSV